MPLTPTQRVRRSEAKSLAAGSRRIPSGMLPGDAADALNRLTAAQYAGSLPGVIARALIEADELMAAETKTPAIPAALPAGAAPPGFCSP